MGLPDKFVEVHVPTRWNSTFRMLNDALDTLQQIDKFLDLERGMPPFIRRDWARLDKIRRVLSQFNTLTLFVSSCQPSMSAAIPVYYQLHDLLDDVTEKKGNYADLDEDIMNAVRKDMTKYDKYYNLMDTCDTYYTALILDSRIKGKLILRELRDENAGNDILDSIRTELRHQYIKPKKKKKKKPITRFS